MSSGSVLTGSTDEHLRLVSVSKRFGSLKAVEDVSLGIERGSITGLIGPNGAGKSTLFDVLAGELKADSGSILFNGLAVHAMPAHQRFRLGLARTFQIAQPFPEMTVLDNLMLAAPEQTGESIWGPLLRSARIRQQETMYLQRAREILEFTALDKAASLAARQLSGGQQKLLELARVLMGKPQMILLDEPAAGVNPSLTTLLMDRVHALNEQGITFLLIEHNMDVVMQHCNPVIAMAKGRVIFQGTAEDAQQCEALLESYLGHPGSAFA